MKCGQLIKERSGKVKKRCPGELQTKRTLADGRSVRRERFCPSCKATQWTVELFEADLLNERQQAQAEQQRIQRLYDQVADQLASIRSTYREFVHALEGK